VIYELSGSELKLNWKLTKYELKQNIRYMDEYSNESTPWHSHP
jgi:hypothetical protein